MRHYWFRVFDRDAARLASELRSSQEATRIFTTEIDPALGARQIPNDLKIVPVSLSVEGRNGANIRARALELTAILARTAAGTLDAKTWLPRAQRSWGTEWLRILGGYWYEKSIPLANFLAFVENAYQIGQIEPPDELVIDLGRHIAGKLAAQGMTAELSFPFAFVLRAQSPSVLADAASQSFGLVLRMALGIARRLRRRTGPEQNIAESTRGIVLIQFEASGIDRLPIGAAQDWIEFSHIDPKRVVYYFDRLDSPLNDDAKTILAQWGHGWVDYNAPFYHLRHPITQSAVCLWQLFSALLMVRNGEGLERWTVLLRLLPKVFWHRAFLAANRVLAVHQGIEFIPNQMALVLACRQEKVAFVWTFSSVMVFMAGWYHSAFADLVLAWGDYDVGYYRTHSMDYRVMATCGVLGYDGAEKDDAQRAANIRSQLYAQPRFVVTLFDSSHTERSIHQSTERCALFYRAVSQLVRDNPDWGCLIKSKATAYDELPIQEGLQDIIAELEASGRCVRLSGSVKPTLAALAADAVACFSINSAGILAALGAQKPTLHFDPNYLSMHPLSIFGGDGKIIFRDVESFQKALRAIAAGDRSFGDLSPWASLFDPFRDGLGRKRSGELMRDYIAARDAGLSLEAALDKAAAEHVRRYGPSFVRTRQAGIACPGDAYWQKVRAIHYPHWPPDFPYSAATAP